MQVHLDFQVIKHYNKHMRNFVSRIYTITGTSGSGKTMVKSFMTELSDRFVEIAKYSTRKLRPGDTDIISVDQIPAFCDIKYETYGERYGLCSDDIIAAFEMGKNPIIVINDLSGIEELRKYIQVTSMFVFRSAPNEQDYIMQEMERNVDGKLSEDQVIAAARKRFRKADSVMRMWMENQYAFDKVIWNTESLDHLFEQIKLYVRAVEDGVVFQQERKSADNTSKLILIAGGGDRSGPNQMSGKDTLIDSVQKVYDLNASVVPKMTTRMQKPEDGDELVCKTLLDGSTNQYFNMDTCDIVYKRKGRQDDILYGIEASKIWNGLNNGKHQFLSVTDEQAIESLINMFGRNRVQSVFVQTFLENDNAKGKDYYSALELFTDRPDLFSTSFLYDSNNPEAREFLLDQLARFFRVHNLTNPQLAKKFERFSKGNYVEHEHTS